MIVKNLDFIQLAAKAMVVGESASLKGPFVHLDNGSGTNISH